MRVLLFFTFLIFSQLIFGQEAYVKGTVRDDKNKPLEAVNISVIGLPGGTSSDRDGNYTIKVPADKNIKLGFSYLGYLKLEYDLKLFPVCDMSIQIVYEGIIHAVVINNFFGRCCNKRFLGMKRFTSSCVCTNSYTSRIWA